MSSGLQFSSLYINPSVSFPTPKETVVVDDVNTTLVTLLSRACYKTVLIPVIAGLITSFGSEGSSRGQGEATCIKYLTSSKAFGQSSLFNKSASTNSSLRGASFYKSNKACFSGLLRSLTVPLTL